MPLLPIAPVARVVLCCAAGALGSGCSGEPWNSPYPPGEGATSTLFASFSERPKHLDPARAYSSDEFRIIGQVYEPVLQYHYLKRPYTLEPLTASELPRVRYLDAGFAELPSSSPEQAIVYSDYEIRLRPGIRYQPHPAFVRAADGSHRYHRLNQPELAEITALGDLQAHATRELIAADYVHQIKRLVHPRLHSPIAELMKDHIVGLKELGEQLERDFAGQPEGAYLDLRPYSIEGVRVLDDYRYTIRLKGKYPQFRFWLAMPFFAPMPWEAEAFYSQSGLVEKNLSLDWYPVGTGPYLLAENNPNRRIVLRRNPYFHEERYPSEGEAGDRESNLLVDAGARLPFIERVMLVLEKETIPYWNKFLQGYYDSSGLASDNFDQAVQFSGQGNAELTPEMRARGVQLETSVSASSYYLGFNMLDPVVGGLDERRCLLRQALNIALDYEEFIAIFMNGRGVPAQGMVPPSIFGYLEGPAGINPYVYRWSERGPQRLGIEEARQRLSQAGYPGGVDRETGKPLVLNLDTAARGADDKSLLNWYRKQFAKLGVQLVLRSTDYNQFRQKITNGNAQIFQWGWNADYPDPENFFFLLYGPNAQVGSGGENAANYRSERFDRLFEQMRNMDDGAPRMEAIQALQAIVRHDAPWVFGFHPKGFALHHGWFRNLKPNLMANNELKYQRILADQRAARQRAWNSPRVWPLLFALTGCMAAMAPAWLAYRRHQRSAAL